MQIKALILAGVALFALTACDSSDEKITISDSGSEDTRIVAEIIRQAARANGAEVAAVVTQDDEAAALAAFEDGSVDLLTISEARVLEGANASEAIAPASANTVALLETTAEARDITSLADLEQSTDNWRIGLWQGAEVPTELPADAITQNSTVEDRGLLVEQLRAGALDAALIMNTDAAVDGATFLVLERDGPAIVAVGVQEGPLADGIAKVAGLVSAADMRAMKAQIEAGDDQLKVVRAFLREKDIALAKEPIDPSRKTALLNVLLFAVLGWILWLGLRKDKDKHAA